MTPLSVRAAVFLILPIVAGCNISSDIYSIYEQDLEISIINGNKATRSDGREDGVVKLSIATGYVCTGSLINNRWVLTAAHCLNYWGNKKLTASNWRDSVASSKIHLYPAFDGLTPEEIGDRVVSLPDVALIELDRPLNVNGNTQDFRRKIYAGPPSALTGKVTRIYSYGPTDIRSLKYGSLYFADFRILELQPSKSRYTITYFSDTEPRLWHGDSGSPNFLGEELIGVTSQGIGVTLLNPLGTGAQSTSANHFRDWVMETVNTELESIPSQGPILPTNRDLAGYVLGSFSAPAKTLPVDFNVEIRGLNKLISTAKATRVARQDIDSQWRDIYNVSIDSYPIDMTKCSYAGIFHCEFDLYIERRDDPSRSIHLNNYAVVR